MFLVLALMVGFFLPVLSSSAMNATASPTTDPSTNSTTNSNSTSSPNRNSSSHTNSTGIKCVSPCACYINQHGMLTIRCQISHLPPAWTIPTTFLSLDLSHNNLSKVPTEFFQKQNLSHLHFLSLQRNDLGIIEEDEFTGLENLQRLDLSFVQLKEWKGNISRSLPSLRYLDVTGNSPWLPNENVFSVKSLRQIKGVSWNANCFNCTLMNGLHLNGTVGLWPGQGGGPPNGSFISPTAPGNMTGGGYGTPGTPPSNNFAGPSSGPLVVHFPKITGENIANKFLKFHYIALCMEVPIQSLCSPSFLEFPKDESLSLPSRLFYVAYILGSLAIVFNFSIIFIYIYSTNMRKINSMLLISNMAFCDMCIGVYAIIIAKINIFNVLLSQSTGVGALTINKLCQVASVLFTVGQVVAVITALLLTVDKFLSIVYCMDPNRKLSRRLSFLVLILCWIGAFLYALVPHFSANPDLIYSITLMCTLPVNQFKSVTISFGLLIALYLANIPFYGKIFLFVRRSSVRMGVRRDAILAKKIALLIFTNLVFFAVPMIMMIVFIFVLGIHFKIEINKPQDPTATLTRYIICYLMPVICLCFNSCLNPFLCAFRQRQFRREFKKCVRNCFLNRLCKVFTTFRSDSSVRTTQPTRVEMYKLSNIESQA